MIVNSFLVIDNFLYDPKAHVRDILDSEFVDIDGGNGVFKNIQPRNDEVAEKVISNLLDYEVAYNFARLSPEGQEEPNFIHTDENMGDLTCVLYLNEDHPIEDGTTIYDGDNVMVNFKSKFNRMIIFDSKLSHSRNIINNFGTGESARLVQVLFLNKK
jgi:hypothetical protein